MSGRSPAGAALSDSLKCTINSVFCGACVLRPFRAQHQEHGRRDGGGRRETEQKVSSSIKRIAFVTLTSPVLNCLLFGSVGLSTIIPVLF